MDLVHLLQAAALLALFALVAGLHARFRRHLVALSLLADQQQEANRASHAALLERLNALHQVTQAQAGHFAQLEASSVQTRDALAAFAVEQEQQNRATLMAALSGVIGDFNTRINDQYKAHLAELAQLVSRNASLQDKHRAQQGEMMHHARRSADQMSATLDAFRELVTQSADLARIGEQVTQALALLGPRQQAVEAALATLDEELGLANSGIGQLQAHSNDILEELTQRTRRTLEGLGQRIGQQASDVGLLVQRAAEQNRSHATETAGKSAQQVAAMNKELGEALNKTLATITKQLAATSTRLSSDIGPMAQQIKRVAEQSRLNK